MRRAGRVADVAIIFLAYPTQELKGHDEEDDPDAGTGEHTVGCDMP